MTLPPMPRAEGFTRLENGQFDVLVIGGGITGCGIARDASLRGLSVALVEKSDFASGTSSRSSRLIHGGVRYLEHGHLHLVFESSAERRRLLRLAPHLVRPLEFTWPVYEGARIPRWKLDAGLWMYDALAMFRNVGRHRRLNRDAVLAREPRLASEGLLGGASYFDAATNDARLTLANAIGAAESGAVMMNHAAVVELHFANDRATGAKVRDRLSGRAVNVRASVVVNATGPWSDDLRRLDDGDSESVRGSKGAHIAVPRERLGNHSALTLLSPVDGRVLFALPAGDRAIIGTTDGYTDSSPEDVRATNEDVRYLLEAGNTFFPAAGLRREDVVAAWAGIRPLVPAAGDTPGSASREHAIRVSSRGVVSITGGKLTTYRVMASDVVKAVYTELRRQSPPNLTARETLPGGDFTELETLVAAAAATIGDERLARHLCTSYGTRWTAVWDEIRKDGGSDPVRDELPYTFGELRFGARREMACTLADLLIRRTHLAFETRDHGLTSAERVALALAPTLGWTSANVRDALHDYENEVSRTFTIL